MAAMRNYYKILPKILNGTDRRETLAGGRIILKLMLQTLGLGWGFTQLSKVQWRVLMSKGIRVRISRIFSWH
jgi:hypothetical protein